MDGSVDLLDVDDDGDLVVLLLDFFFFFLLDDGFRAGSFCFVILCVCVFGRRCWP